MAALRGFNRPAALPSIVLQFGNPFYTPFYTTRPKLGPVGSHWVQPLSIRTTFRRTRYRKGPIGEQIRENAEKQFPLRNSKEESRTWLVSAQHQSPRS